jgi:hypothetical protein
MFSTTIFLFITIAYNMSTIVESYTHTIHRLFHKTHNHEMYMENGGSNSMLLTRNDTKLYESLLKDSNNWECGEVVWDFRDENETAYS